MSLGDTCAGRGLSSLDHTEAWLPSSTMASRNHTSHSIRTGDYYGDFRVSFPHLGLSFRVDLIDCFLKSGYRIDKRGCEVSESGTSILKPSEWSSHEGVLGSREDRRSGKQTCPSDLVCTFLDEGCATVNITHTWVIDRSPRRPTFLSRVDAISGEMR